MRIEKSGCIELNQTCCCTEKFNITLSLCGVLGVTLYFSKSFLEAVAEVLYVIRRKCGRTLIGLGLGQK